MVCVLGTQGAPQASHLPLRNTKYAMQERIGFQSERTLEVSLPLSIFHRGLVAAVVGPVGPFCHAGGGDLFNDSRQAAGSGADRAGAGHVADRAEAHSFTADDFTRLRCHIRADRQHDPVPSHNLSFVGKVKAGQVELLLGDVLPDVKLGPIADGKDAEMFIVMFAPVEEVP